MSHNSYPNRNFNNQGGQWNTTPNNGGVRAPMANQAEASTSYGPSNSSINLYDFALEEGCRFHNTKDHNEKDCLEFCRLTRSLQTQMDDEGVRSNEDMTHFLKGKGTSFVVETIYQQESEEE